jgi:DHA1 family multidrug resistance protein-like MFS transporter
LISDRRADTAETAARTDPDGLPHLGAAAYWRQTLWAMVGIQFVMTAAFSMLTPIMPLFLPVLGVESDSAIAIWAGVLNGITSLVAAFASPLWGQVADRHGRKLMLLRSSLAIGLFTALMGASGNVWQFFGCRALMVSSPGFPAPRSRSSQARCRRTGSAIRWAGFRPASLSARWSGRSSAASWPI